jgi:Kdo2-lipid IVA lauroyltransferase/acyltransferase
VTVAGRSSASSRRGKVPLRFRLEVLGVGLLYRLVPLLPRETLIALGRGLGRLGFAFLRHDRKVALANLDLAYGDSLTPREKRRIARRAFENFGQVGIEIFWARRLDQRVLDQIIEMDREKTRHVYQINEQKRGLIALVGHMGSWEVMNLQGAILGFPMATLARRLRNDPLNDLVNANRKAHGSEVILHDDAARPLLKALKQKKFVAIPLDQNTRPDRGGCYVEFFGRPVAASRAAAMFTIRTGVPIVPAVCYPIRGGRYRIEWWPELELPPEDTPDRERVITQQCMRVLEAMVRKQPDAWLWMYRRWKYRPTEDATGFPYYSKHVPEPAA